MKRGAAPPSDEVPLIRGCQEGDRAAQRALYERYVGAIFNLMLRMTGNHDDAGDLTQEVFIKAFQSIGSFRGESPLGAWLRKIALNEARGRLRKTGRRDEVLRQGPWTETGSDRTTDTDDSLDVADALGSIEPDAREILLLRYHQDLSHAEIAETMEIPMGTVASRLNRARAAIKKILDERR